MKLKPIILALVAAITLAMPFKASAHGDVKSLIESRMSWGDADRLAFHFMPNVTLELLQDPEMVSKEEAKENMRAFFKKYPPMQVEVQSQGKYANGTRYFTGVYKITEVIQYPCYFEAAYDQDHGEYHISMIRIEKMN